MFDSLLRIPVTEWVGLALALPCIAVTVRRLRDSDRSGYWLLVGGVVVYVAALAAYAIRGSFAVVFGLVILAICIAMFVMLINKGNQGANRYGPARV